MATVKIDTEKIDENDHSEFAIAFNFDGLITMAISYLEQGFRTHHQEQAKLVLKDADFNLILYWQESYDEPQPYITVKTHINDELYISLIDQKSAIEDTIKKTLQKLNPDWTGFHINLTPSSLNTPPTDTWRANPQYKIGNTTQTIDQDSLERIWGDAEKLHVFISHKDSIKDRAHKLKELLAEYGAIAFVAHDDIEEGEEWLDAMEKALFSSDALIALLSDDFKDSEWTDQEVGIAFGRQLPILPIKLEKTTNPYGFMGKIQGYGLTEGIVTKLIGKMLRDDRTKTATTSSLTEALKRIKGMDEAFRICKLLTTTNLSLWKSRQKENFLIAFETNELLPEIPDAVRIHETIKPKESHQGVSSLDDEIPF